MKKSILTLLLAVGLIAFVGKAKADSIYTDAASFSNAISTPNYFTNFIGLNGTLSQPFSLSGNGYSTAITTGSGNNLDASGGHIFDSGNVSLIFSFTLGDNVTAIGGNFFDGAAQNVLATLNDGTNYFINAASGFVGFTSTSAITSLTITAPGGGIPGANSIQFGAAVPEPSTYALCGLGALALVIVLRRKKA
ncbi:MAG: PEP-CTERM sorting domain-containing protein [bacterium]